MSNRIEDEKYEQEQRAIQREEMSNDNLANIVQELEKLNDTISRWFECWKHDNGWTTPSKVIEKLKQGSEQK